MIFSKIISGLGFISIARAAKEVHLNFKNVNSKCNIIVDGPRVENRDAHIGLHDIPLGWATYHSPDATKRVEPGYVWVRRPGTPKQAFILSSHQKDDFWRYVKFSHCKPLEAKILEQRKHVERPAYLLSGITLMGGKPFELGGLKLEEKLRKAEGTTEPNVRKCLLFEDLTERNNFMDNLKDAPKKYEQKVQHYKQKFKFNKISPEVQKALRGERPCKRITIHEIWNKMNQKFPCTKLAGPRWGNHIPLNAYQAVDKQIIKELYKCHMQEQNVEGELLNKFTYKLGAFSCSDFSRYFQAAVSFFQEEQKTVLPLAIAEVWTGNHALNIILTKDSENRTDVLIFEPQTGEFITDAGELARFGSGFDYLDNGIVNIPDVNAIRFSKF